MNTSNRCRLVARSTEARRAFAAYAATPSGPGGWSKGQGTEETREPVAERSPSPESSPTHPVLPRMDSSLLLPLATPRSTPPETGRRGRRARGPARLGPLENPASGRCRRGQRADNRGVAVLPREKDTAVDGKVETCHAGRAKGRSEAEPAPQIAMRARKRLRKGYMRATGNLSRRLPFNVNNSS